MTFPRAIVCVVVAHCALSCSAEPPANPPVLADCEPGGGGTGRAVVDEDADGLATDVDALSFGLEPTTPERDADYSISAPAQLPASASAISLEAKFPKPLSQGRQGSCVAWSAAAVATYFAALREDKSPDEVWASPSFIYKRVLDEENNACNKGTYVNDGLDQLVKEGAASLKDKPYSDASCHDGSAVSDSHRYQIGGWVRIKPFSRSEVKAALGLGVPVAVGLQVPVNFRTWHGKEAAAVFKSCRPADGKALGGHAMVIVGYDDERGAYRLLNSWGSDWGDRGLMWWDYDDLEARDALEGYMVLPVTESKDRSGVDATTLTVDITGAKRLVFGDFAGVSLGVKANAPVRVTDVSFAGPSTFSKRYRKFILETYLLVEAKDLRLGTYDVSVSGSIGGVPFVRNARVEVKD